MKNKFIAWEHLLYTIPKCSLRMKLTTLFLALALFKIQANTYSQTVKISLDLESVKVMTVLQSIESQSDYKFLGNQNVLDDTDLVSIHVKRKPLGEVLKDLFLTRGIEYKVIEKHIILTKRPVKSDTVQEKLSEGPSGELVQQLEVSGKVTDEEGVALPGASIVVRGTTIGTQTDFDGYYTIAAQAGDVLQFSYLGYKTVGETVADSPTINVTLVEEASSLNEVVVIGFGTERKALLTGSVASVKAEQIEDLPVSGVDGILQGQAAGVQVMQNSGTPGGEMSVRIRGLTSISGSSQPLYIIDGIPVTTGDFGQVGYSGQGASALTDLNPSDIESISVLKDASSTSIYGARASNGIVLITTKRGKEQRSAVSLNVYNGFQRAWNKLDMLNAREWMEYRNDLTKSTVFTPEQMSNITVDTDWQDIIFRPATISNYELSTTGGSEKTKFFINGTYFEQKGILIGTNYNRLSARINVDHKISDKVTIGTNIGLSHAKTDRVESDQTLHGPLPNGISTPAIFPVYNEDGSYNQQGPYSNAVSIAKEAINENFTYRTNSNIYLDYEIIQGLTFSTKWGIDFLNFREHAFESTKTVQGAKYNGLGFETYSNISNIVSNNLLKYTTDWGKLKIDVLGGYSFESRNYRSSYIRGQDFADDNLQYISAASTIVSASASASDSGLRSYFGRINYNFDNKYLLDLSGRSDASTKFGENNKTGFFPAASFAWRVAEESFMENLSFLSDLKLRVSYGLTGNDDISPFLFSELYGNTSYGGSPAIYPSNIPNPDLKWESTTQLNLGLNLGFFNDRIAISADYYDKQTKDLLLSRPLPNSSGFSSITENVGRVENKGVEITLDTRNFTGNFVWNTQFNISGNRNKVLELYNGQPIDDIGRGGNRIMEGQPIGIFYSFRSLGVDPSTGDIVYADTNFDGEITSEDRTVVGNPHPDFIFGLTNSFSYKGFDLSVFLQGSYGNDVFHGSRLFLESLQGGDNQLAAITRRWQQPGDVTDIPRATNDPVKAAQNKRVSSRFIEDGSYMRIKNLTIGYNLDRNALNKTLFTDIRLYVSAQNLFTFTHYTGLDPEVNYRGDDNSVIGTDFFTYPQAQTFTLGVNLKL